MSEQAKSIATMLLPLLSAINLLLASFGVKPFENQQLNALSLVLSVMIVFVGFLYNHFKHMPTTTITSKTETTPTLQTTSVMSKQEMLEPLTETPKASNAPPTFADGSLSNTQVKDASTI